MRLLAVLVLISTPLAAADELRLALTLKAQAAFERVDLAGVAHLEDASACVQSQAAALSVAAPAEDSVLHYRKGFCLLAGAAVTRRADEYAAAAGELDKAIETWPSRIPPPGSKKGTVEPVSPGLRVLTAIAHLEAAPGTALDPARSALTSTPASAPCSSDVMPAAFCMQVLQKGREWLGWMALGRDDLSEAARDFAGSNGAWSDWVAGRQAFADRRYESAAERYQAAVGKWEIERHESTPGFLQSLNPRPDLAAALADLGGAQLLAGQPAAAIATLDRSVREDPSLSRPLYLRARAKEVAGDLPDALTDYNLASRTAFASAKELASGEAHLYRGILLYRRKDVARAEDEFSSALNFEIPAALRADAQAWRHLAAVASGSCEASRGYLERALETVSPYFPKAEARALAASCPVISQRAAHGEPAN